MESSSIFKIEMKFAYCLRIAMCLSKGVKLQLKTPLLIKVFAISRVMLEMSHHKTFLKQ